MFVCCSGKQYGQTFLGRLSGTFTRNSYNQGAHVSSSSSTNPLQQQSQIGGISRGGGGGSPLERPLTTGGYPTEGEVELF